MNPWIVIEVGNTTRVAVLNDGGLSETLVEVPMSIGEHEIGNMYTAPENAVCMLARNETEAQALATLCAKRQPNHKWMWFELRGIALCKPGDVEITQVTDKGALPA